MGKLHAKKHEFSEKSRSNRWKLDQRLAKTTRNYRLKRVGRLFDNMS